MNPPLSPATPAQDKTAQPPAPKPRFVWSWRLQANKGAGPNARLRARTRLTMAHWPGDIEVASRIASLIVDNAVEHGTPYTDDRIILRMEVMDETRDLHIYADDADPHFHNFAEAGEGYAATESGLWWVTRLGGRVSWHVKQDDGTVLGKTVQVIVPTQGSRA